jgi:hypothetical protein
MRIRSLPSAPPPSRPLPYNVSFRDVLPLAPRGSHTQSEGGSDCAFDLRRPRRGVGIKRGNLRTQAGRLSSRNQTLTGRDYPSVAPAHDRVNLSNSWHRVSARRLPDATWAFQDCGTTINFTYRPALNGCRFRLWHRRGSSRDLRPLPSGSRSTCILFRRQ